MKRNRPIFWTNLWILSVLVMVFCFSAQAAEWKLISEGAERRGWINQLVIHPTKQDVFYAATEGAGVLMSEDKGAICTPGWPHSECSKPLTMAQAGLL